MLVVAFRKRGASGVDGVFLRPINAPKITPGRVAEGEYHTKLANGTPQTNKILVYQIPDDRVHDLSFQVEPKYAGVFDGFRKGQSSGQAYEAACRDAAGVAAADGDAPKLGFNPANIAADPSVEAQFGTLNLFWHHHFTLFQEGEWSGVFADDEADFLHGQPLFFTLVYEDGRVENEWLMPRDVEGKEGLCRAFSGIPLRFDGTTYADDVVVPGEKKMTWRAFYMRDTGDPRHLDQLPFIRTEDKKSYFNLGAKELKADESARRFHCPLHAGDDPNDKSKQWRYVKQKGSGRDLASWEGLTANYSEYNPDRRGGNKGDYELMDEDVEFHHLKPANYPHQLCCVTSDGGILMVSLPGSSMVQDQKGATMDDVRQILTAIEKENNIIITGAMTMCNGGDVYMSTADEQGGGHTFHGQSVDALQSQRMRGCAPVLKRAVAQ